MKKILLITTGGTIASVPENGGLTPKSAGACLLDLVPELNGLCEIHVKELFCLDSSNIQPEHWITMAESVFRALSVFDGIVITHGTDTMAYSAGALSFMLQNLKKPVILTGSQLPMETPDTDGKQNLRDAFLAACDSRLAGVYIVFDRLIIHGCHAVKTSSRDFRAFESLGRAPEGRIRDGRVVLDRSPAVPPAVSSAGAFTLNACLDPNVFLLKLCPGISPALLESLPSLGAKAVLIEAFGLGGIPGLDRSLLPAVRNLTARNIPVLITTQCLKGGADMSVYEVGIRAMEAGARCAGSITTEAAVTKLMWILGQTGEPDKIYSIFFRDFVGEFAKI